MSSHPPLEQVEYTPEQRRLLARAYQLILHWRRDDTTREPDADRSVVLSHIPSNAPNQVGTKGDHDD